MVDDEFLKSLHHVLLEVRSLVLLPPFICDLSFYMLCYTKIHVEEGAMVCPNCSHVYPISNGIPNMVRTQVFTPDAGNTHTCHGDTVACGA